MIIPSTNAHAAPFKIPEEVLESKPLYTFDTIDIYLENLPLRLKRTIITKINE